MALRKDLEPPLINERVLPDVEELIEGIAESLEKERWYFNDNNDVIFEDEKVTDEINGKVLKLKELTKKNIEIIQFNAYWSYSSIEDIAIELLFPEPPYIRDLSVDDITELLEEFTNRDQIEIVHEKYYIDLLEKSLRLVNISDYIYFPELKGISSEPREIAKKMIADSKNPPNILL